MNNDTNTNDGIGPIYPMGSVQSTPLTLEEVTPENQEEYVVQELRRITEVVGKLADDLAKALDDTANGIRKLADEAAIQ